MRENMARPPKFTITEIQREIKPAANKKTPVVNGRKIYGKEGNTPLINAYNAKIESQIRSGSLKKAFSEDIKKFTKDKKPTALYEAKGNLDVVLIHENLKNATSHLGTYVNYLKAIREILQSENVVAEKGLIGKNNLEANKKRFENFDAIKKELIACKGNPEQIKKFMIKKLQNILFKNPKNNAVKVLLNELLKM
jgi:hypothetical protein